MAEDVNLLERGNLYFFYRPRVEEKHPESEEDVQRFYMVLSPDDENRFRLAIVGQKELPEPQDSGHEKYWGFVKMVSSSPAPIKEEIGREEYETKTRGKRVVGTARPAGEGVYKILNHKGHTHFVYVLELPRKPGEVQQEFNIEDQASYVVTVKNPDKPSPRNVGLSEARDAEYPSELQEKFRGRRFSELDPVDFLNFEGTQFILISASDNIKKELDVQIKRDNENDKTADVYTDLKINREKRPRKPLFEGKWE